MAVAARQAQQNVRRLDVAMKDSMLMRVLDGAGESEQHSRGNARIHRSRLLAEPLIERGSVAKLNRQVAGGIAFARFVHRHDIGMVEPGQSLRLTKEAVS